MQVVSYRSMLIVLGMALLPLITIACAHVFLNLEVRQITSDVSAIANQHPLKGALSSLGILIWWMSAAVYFFAACAFCSRLQSLERYFLIASGLLSAYLGFDDLFMMHEFLAPRYLGVSEKYVYLCLGTSAFLYLYFFRDYLLRADAKVLLVAMACLFASMSVDLVFQRYTVANLGDWEFLIEDGCKWLGIVFWAFFCWTRCKNIFNQLAGEL